MRLCTSLFLSLICITSACGQNEVSFNNTRDKESLYDTSRIAVLVYDFRMDWPFDSTYRPATLEKQDYHRLDSLIKVAIAGYNSGLDSAYIGTASIDTVSFNYKRQYFPVRNAKEEKLVWANFFCRTYNRDWKKHLFSVDDGGNCYFNLILNLTTGETTKPFVNGYAYAQHSYQ